MTLIADAFGDLTTRYRRRYPTSEPQQLNSDDYNGRGEQRLKDGEIGLAVEDFSAAIEIAPEHGIALAHLAIAAVRASDAALLERVTERYRFASRQLLMDLGEVGRWYAGRWNSRSSDPGGRPGVEQNRLAFNAFLNTLAPVLEDDRERLFWLGEAVRNAVCDAPSLAGALGDLMTRYRRRYPTSEPQQLSSDDYNGRGEQRLKDGEIGLAVEDFSAAIEIAPEHGIALAHLAIAAVRASDAALLEKVTERYRLASRQLLMDLGEVGKWYVRPPDTDAAPGIEQNRLAFEAFIDVLAPALENDRQRLFWLGDALYAGNAMHACSEVFTRYCHRYADDEEADALLASSIVLSCDLENSDHFWKTQLEGLEQTLGTGEPLGIDPYYVLLAGVDFGFFSRVCRRRSMDFVSAATHAPQRRSVYRPNGRIKLGFIFPYSWFTSCSAMLSDLLVEFDHSQFEICGYSLISAKEDDDFRVKFQKHFDSFTTFDGLSAKAAAQVVAADGIDIALELSGHTRPTCLPILAHRPAPIQAHLIGWGTLVEAPFIDYLITDPHYHAKHLRDMTTETYALLPGGPWVYPPPEDDDGARHVVPRDGGPFRFCSFNHPHKIDRESFEAWLEILRATEDSVLVLCHFNMGDAVRNMHAFAERGGVAPARLLFVPVVDQPSHFRRLRSMDLALDTLRLGGGATTMDAIWVGLPVLTACTHDNYLHPSRGIFGGLEMSEEVLTDVPAFIDRAIHLRNNPNSLAALKQKFLTRRSSLLSFNPPRYATALQAALRSMWTRHLRGDPPATFTV